jgi:hypothetical protein
MGLCGLLQGYIYLFLGRYSGWGVKPTTHLQAVPRSRKYGSLHPLPIRLHGVVLNSLRTGATLRFYGDDADLWTRLVKRDVERVGCQAADSTVLVRQIDSLGLQRQQLHGSSVFSCFTVAHGGELNDYINYMRTAEIYLGEVL